jgi:hypothetical protein
MLNQVSSSALSALTERAQAEELGALVEHSQSANGSASAYLKSKVQAFELRYEMSSVKLHADLAQGQQKETAEVAEWLFYLDALEAHGG